MSSVMVSTKSSEPLCLIDPPSVAMIIFGVVFMRVYIPFARIAHLMSS